MPYFIWDFVLQSRMWTQLIVVLNPLIGDQLSFAKDTETFNNNLRPKTLKLIFCPNAGIAEGFAKGCEWNRSAQEGSWIQNVVLKDSPEKQEVKLDHEFKTSGVILIEFGDFFDAGSKYADFCISEISLVF